MDKIEKAMRRAAAEREQGRSSERTADSAPEPATEPATPRRAGEALADRLAGARPAQASDLFDSDATVAEAASAAVPSASAGDDDLDGPDTDDPWSDAGDDDEAAVDALEAGASGWDDDEDVEVIKPEFHYTQSSVKPIDQRVLESHRILTDRTPGRIVNAYKMLRTQVLQRLERHNLSTIAMISPRDDEGRTLTAINLSLSIARDTQHTALLVDLDLRAPGIHKQFGLDVRHGLEDHLFDGVPMQQIMVNPGIQRFVLLPTRAAVADSSELLASRRVGELVDELKMRYDSRIVIFDLPPLLTSDDALAFLPHVDAVLLVAANGRTRKTDLNRTLDLLGDKAIVGTVLNRADRT